MAKGAGGLSWHAVGSGIWGVSQGAAEWLAAYRLMATSDGRIGPALAGFSMLEYGTWSFAMGLGDLVAGLVGEPSLNTQLRTALAGIEVALDDQRLTWRAAAFYRSVVAGLMFNPYSPVNLGSVTLWAVAVCSLVARKSVPGKELLWDSLAGTRALIAGSGDLPGAAD